MSLLGQIKKAPLRRKQKRSPETPVTAAVTQTAPQMAHRLTAATPQAPPQMTVTATAAAIVTMTALPRPLHLQGALTQTQEAAAVQTKGHQRRRKRKNRAVVVTFPILFF